MTLSALPGQLGPTNQHQSVCLTKTAWCWKSNLVNNCKYVMFCFICGKKGKRSAREQNAGAQRCHQAELFFFLIWCHDHDRYCRLCWLIERIIMVGLWLSHCNNMPVSAHPFFCTLIGERSGSQDRNDKRKGRSREIEKNLDDSWEAFMWEWIWSMWCVWDTPKEDWT